MSIPNFIYIRRDGDGGIEMTSKDDPEAVEFIRSDNVTRTSIAPEQDMFRSHPEDDFDYLLKNPCNRCEYHHGDVEEYPCSMCVHSIYNPQ